MKNFVLSIFFCSFTFFGCQSQVSRPEPHLELGQRISFVGGNGETEYVLIGYRDQLESKTEDLWNDQNYLVFVYLNNDDELKQGIIHRNAILKK